jgi:hypothetical protein
MKGRMGRAGRSGAWWGGARLRRIAAVAWTGDDGPPLGRLLAVGAAVWLAYAIVWVRLEGPVLDEAAIAAPLIAGDAGYPAGHPNAWMYRHAVLLLYQLGALQWLIHPDPWWIAATRNVAFLFVSAFVPFTIALACTRRPAWGHVVAALTLSETTCSAVGTYLMWVFPGVYSSGHFGIHLAVLATVLVAAGFDRLGGVLAGLMAAVHATMVLVVWPAVAGVLWLRRRRGEPVRAVVVSALVGLAAAGAVAGVIAWRTADDAAAPPYDARADGSAILRTFIRTTDPHRQPLPLRSPIGLVGPTAFAILAGVALARATRVADRRALEGVVVTGAVAWTWVLGTRALQAVLPVLPLPLLMVMPARFANLAMLLVVPLAVVALASSVPARTGAMLASLLLVVEAGLLGAGRQLAYIHLLYVTLGVAMGAVVGSPWRRASPPWSVLAALALALAIAAVRALDGSVVVWGFGLGVAGAAILAAGLRPDARVTQARARLLAAGCAAVASLALRGPHPPNLWDFGSERQSAEEGALATWLHEHAPPRAMIVTPPFPPTWLEPKTGHPVLFDMMTLLSMTYFPAEAEPVARLVRDVYDVDYANPSAVDALRGPDGMLRPSSPVWLRTWATRPCETWREIGGRWSFAYVLAPREVALQLPGVWSGRTWTLYEVPAACGGAAAPT